MQRDNLGRELVRAGTTMRHAFAAAFEGRDLTPTPLRDMVWDALCSRQGTSKAPAWRISRRGR